MRIRPLRGYCSEASRKALLEASARAARGLGMRSEYSARESLLAGQWEREQVALAMAYAQAQARKGGDEQERKGPAIATTAGESEGLMIPLNIDKTGT